MIYNRLGELVDLYGKLRVMANSTRDLKYHNLSMKVLNHIQFRYALWWRQ